MPKANSVATVGIRKLTREYKEILENVEIGGQPYIVTDNGRPVAALLPIPPDWLDTLIVASMTETVEAIRDAETGPRSGYTAAAALKELRQTQ